MGSKSGRISNVFATPNLKTNSSWLSKNRILALFWFLFNFKSKFVKSWSDFVPVKEKVLASFPILFEFHQILIFLRRPISKQTLYDSANSGFPCFYARKQPTEWVWLDFLTNWASSRLLHDATFHLELLAWHFQTSLIPLNWLVGERLLARSQQFHNTGNRSFEG